MSAWPIVAGLAAALGPLSWLPTLKRVVVGRTADGISVLLCAVSVTSYGAWLALADGVETAMFVALIASTCFAVVQLVYVRRWRAVSLWSLPATSVAAVAAFTLASVSSWLAVIVLVAVDLVWYVRAIADIVRSHAADAVSPWGWVMSVCANAAWSVEAFTTGRTALGFQCSVMLCCAVAAWGTTVVVHRRAAVAA